MDFKETETIPNGIGSGFLKQKQRSGCDENDLLNSKMLKTDFSVSKDTALQRSNSHHQMLSFSPPKSQVSLPTKGTILSDYQHAPALYSKNAEYYGPGSLNPNMHGTFPGFRGPFTPSQWIELEHQALIYKYLNSNVPVPSNLLIPIRNSFNSLRMIYGSSAGSLPPLSWNSFQLGFSTNNDPEPGRCRRTDGKKWRCSRDAVIDQKYCERHINRGRHRSRKPVEGQTGHALSGTTLTTSKLVSNGSASNNLNISLNQFMSIGDASPSTGSPVNRTQDRQGISTLSPSIINTKSSDGPYEESSNSDFGFVSSDSLLNPSTKDSYMDTKNYPAGQEHHPLHRFIDACPKNNTDRSTMISWPEELKSDWTQLSMSTSSSMGGPLGEVLNSTTSLKLMESSPIGVLQKASFA